MHNRIKHKIGACIDCGQDGVLIAGRCAKKCYWRYRGKINAAKPAIKDRDARKQDLTAWFNMQLTMRPAVCENPDCGCRLADSMVINPRAIVAHILPKSTFKEVATHPLNRVFLCNGCHHKYDNGSADTMPQLLVICRTRYGAFKDKILPVNMARVPEFLSDAH